MAQNTDTKEVTITVQSANPPRGTFFERDERHPNNGVAWVRGHKRAEVAKTRKVLAAIAEGRIVTVDKSDLEDADPATIEGAAQDANQEATSEAESGDEGKDATDADSGAQKPSGDDSDASPDKDVVRTDAGVPNVLTDRPVQPTPRPSTKPKGK